MKKFNPDEKIVIENVSDSPVGINLPQFLLHVEWERKGAKKTIPYEKLEQALYYYGVEYMFRNGILYIEDMEAKRALGLEPEEATEPENIIVLNDKQKKRLLTTAPLEEFKKVVSELSFEQMQELGHFAVENEILDFNRSEVFKKAIGLDVIRAVQLNRESKELDKADSKNQK